MSNVSITIKPRRTNVAIELPGTQGRPGIPGDGSGGNQTRQLLTIATTGQTIFALTSSPARPDLSLLFLNGIQSRYGLHYTINNTVLTWFSLQLQPSDRLEILY